MLKNNLLNVLTIVLLGVAASSAAQQTPIICRSTTISRAPHATMTTGVRPARILLSTPRAPSTRDQLPVLLATASRRRRTTRR